MRWPRYQTSGEPLPESKLNRYRYCMGPAFLRFWQYGLEVGKHNTSRPPKQCGD
jgi:hypothetical protein